MSFIHGTNGFPLESNLSLVIFMRFINDYVADHPILPAKLLILPFPFLPINISASSPIRFNPLPMILEALKRCEAVRCREQQHDHWVMYRAAEDLPPNYSKATDSDTKHSSDHIGSRNLSLGNSYRDWTASSFDKFLSILSIQAILRKIEYMYGRSCRKFGVPHLFVGCGKVAN
ncbi:hypothetical protein M422DRAFT_51964 [Sphaerobolus stellatus SS14]|uniref:Uncharacterized protein n=1 Tax=Sphaerobolus stellatus (strain SS14) TaxID=990650 RepID=A0A0C9VB74_SPHS4|nr:hypothetical protein M422DRAFT_51964 [Sphaerobolus stellatus SS14]